jgi:hypothetical protein
VGEQGFLGFPPGYNSVVHMHAPHEKKNNKNKSEIVVFVFLITAYVQETKNDK